LPISNGGAGPALTQQEERPKMTEGETSGTSSQPEGYEPPRPGDEEGRRWEEAVEHEATEVDFEDNELHAAGRTCVRCGRVITPEDDVRRTASGAYEHEDC
jgi:hypothetical protein